MRRKNVKQISHSRVFPKYLKQLMNEFLSWFVLKVNASKPFIPVINEVLNQTNQKKINYIELNAGGGIETVKPFLDENVEVNISDFNEFNVQNIGVYLFVNSFHLLSVDKAIKALNDITEKGHPIVIVEGNNDSLWQIVGMTFFVPLTVLIASPFVKPFRFTRLIFTYVIPILPLILVIDGCLALIKLYNPNDLKELVSKLNTTSYEWKMGKNDNGRGGKIIYLTGIKK